MADKTARQRPAAAILWPRDVEAMLNVSSVTRWRMERDGRLPPRDAHVGSETVGWLKPTIERMLHGGSHAATGA
jgi:predicted DNA-binding transcriptional regulator AlpA